MSKYKRFDTPLQALIYQAECELATVAELAMKKSSSKSARERHVSIAANAVYNIDQFVGHDLSEYQINMAGFYTPAAEVTRCTRVWETIDKARASCARSDYDTIHAVIWLWMNGIREGNS